MNNRIAGFDLARAYAIFGMFIVNLNMTFGDYKDTSIPGKFMALFAGNSSSVFVILAGMGVALLAGKYEATAQNRSTLRNIILKRALFLFVAGLLLNTWWPADILHMYGCYLAIAAFVLFANKRLYLILAGVAIVIFHALLMFIPYETAWNFQTFRYGDFYTVTGFFRNTFYNGWNPVFPWMAYFLLGMFLGKLNWKETAIQKRVFTAGLITYATISIIEVISYPLNFPKDLMEFIHADYLPPMLPFLLSTAGFSLVLISGFMFIGTRVNSSQLARYFAQTGQMTFTHYVSHVTIGVLLLAMLTGKEYGDQMFAYAPTEPLYILAFCVSYFGLCVLFSAIWSRYFKKGPLEFLMRKFSDPKDKRPSCNCSVIRSEPMLG